MINRTKERILAWIANALEVFSILFSAILLYTAFSTPQLFEATLMTEEDINVTQIEQFSTIFIGMSTFMFITSVIFIVLGILATLWIGKKDKPASIIFITIGAISLLGNTIAGILWLITGIMLISRKPSPNTPIDSNDHEALQSNQDSFRY
ncbi:DUF4064 domain-containing protein [Staphylococcus massiliensis]|uniref:DUF4064 domain-containing protein n=1 Tax=Staphylococcus massiliensis TaxID=555791 RepID=UPI001EDFFFFC|nr:DUF4064 domain-containing protein [Staphylococcus massiliensis]MCG3402136.1 DUF4064 domain-containing protein [Staphylococcus massiliensis]